MTEEAKPTLFLSPSCAATILQHSERHAWRRHYAGGREVEEPTANMREGKLLDRLVFGVGGEIVIVDAKNWQTNAAKEARAAAEADRKIAVLKGHFDEATEAAARIRAEILALGIPLEGDGVQAQRKLTWESGGVPCKGFADLVVARGGGFEAYDLKTTENAAPGAWKVDLRSSLQHAAYIEGLETLHPEAAGRVSLRFIVAESDGGGVTIVEPDGQFQALARSRWARAVKRWGACLASGEFPGYSRDVVRAAPRPWDLTEEFDANVPSGGSEGVTF
jgi:hypothetical protein